MRSTNRALIVITLNGVLMSLGWGVWQSLFNNFAVEEVGVLASEIGVIQSIREIPGLIGILVGFLALFLAEIRIAGVSLVAVGAGILLTSVVGDVPSLIGATVLMSMGFHFFNPSNTSALLLSVESYRAPRALGRLNSFRAIASIAAYVAVILGLAHFGYRPLLRLAGILVVAGALVLLPLGRQKRKRREAGAVKNMRPQRRYWLYYALKFTLGSRRNIFRTFAIFLLVQQYQVTAHVITLLYLINSLLGVYLHQAFGKIVARYGERRVLTFGFGLLVPIFLGYGVVPLLQPLASPAFQIPGVSVGDWVLFPALEATPALMVLLGLFVLDQVLLGFSIALESYLQRIAVKAADITPNVAMGQAVDHIAAVAVPVVGGAIWASFGAQYTFSVGVVIVLIALGLTRLMRDEATDASVAEQRADVVVT